jgi:hypothetical protein
MGWITTILTNGLARKALGLLLAVLTITLFLLNLRRAGERAGRLAERLQESERTHEIQRQMLDAASRRPHDRDALPHPNAKAVRRTPQFTCDRRQRCGFALILIAMFHNQPHRTFAELG